ncbi:unnamed protein product [Acanthoscelides obtectus]|uniref:Zinc finger PHD-type domain-containing protein n=1 Tax=Acanthoscelides obtectus TaxID=200917 RepID=A0A9P0M1Z6_ACAOB|nr:unnamed protein product [Acanthoscelides obtectus]CAK1628399.1 hypothetical protein AOBTE_LOCUS5185 [Acanthoscelides obtectus]
MKNKRETYKNKKTDTKDRIEKGIGEGKGKGKGKGKGTDKVDEIADDTVDENDGNAVDSDDESTICLECTESYVDSVPGEQWIQCITCKLWAHSKCVRGKKQDSFYTFDNNAEGLRSQKVPLRQKGHRNSPKANR